MKKKSESNDMSNWLYLHSASASNPSDPNKQNTSQHLYAQVQKFKQEEAALAEQEKAQAAPAKQDRPQSSGLPSVSEEKKTHHEKTNRKKADSSAAVDETGHALAHRALLCFFLAVCRCCGLR